MSGIETQKQQREGAYMPGLDGASALTFGSPVRPITNCRYNPHTSPTYRTQKPLLTSTPKGKLGASPRVNGYSVPSRAHRRLKKKPAIGLLQKLYHEQHAEYMRLVAEYINAKEQLQDQDRRLRTELCSKMICIEDEALDITKVFSVPQKKKRSHGRSRAPLKSEENGREEEKGGSEVMQRVKEESEESAARHNGSGDRPRCDALLREDICKPVKEEYGAKTATKGEGELEVPGEPHLFNDGFWRDKFPDRFWDLQRDLEAVPYAPPSFAHLFEN